MKVSKNYKIGLIDPQSEIESLYLDFIENYEPANTDQILCEMTKEQILRSSRHQFIEGDVEHWWHEETEKGIRTKISDDLLWLPFVTADYVNFTEDYSILEEETTYKIGAPLEDKQNERYDFYGDSDFRESLYKHCINAIEKSLNFGEHGLPKIGAGDCYLLL